jgi:cbb3-type cytochrome oxidase maturation protein
MSVILILILASLAVALTFLGAFIWSVNTGQYEDTCTPAMRMLIDDGTLPQGHEPNIEHSTSNAQRPDHSTARALEARGSILKVESSPTSHP